MAETVVQIVTAYANKAAAISLSTPAGGIPAASFAGSATTNSTGHSASPTHCWSNGPMDDALIAQFVAEPSTYTVTFYPNRNPWPALSGHIPVLYPYLGV